MALLHFGEGTVLPVENGLLLCIGLLAVDINCQPSGGVVRRLAADRSWPDA